MSRITVLPSKQAYHDDSYDTEPAASLDARITALVTEKLRPPRDLMIEALERELARAERVRAFVREALDSDQAVEAGAEAVYAAEDVHAWLDRLACGRKGERPPAFVK